MSNNVNFRKKFRFRDDTLDYTFQLKKRNWKWLWLLLLLLPLLLLIRCERDIAVTTVDKESGDEIAGVEVTLNYTSYYLYKDGQLFCSEEGHQTLKTDGEGRGVFKDMGCSVYSYIFRCLSRASFVAAGDCYVMDPAPSECNFHYTRNHKITLSPRVTDVSVNVVDRETNDPVADARILYTYKLGKTAKTDSTVSDATGKAKLTKVPECGEVTFTRVSCYGYEDLTNEKRSVAAMLSAPDSATLRLQPLKQSFTYFVKNKFTHEPVPDATVEVTLTSPNGNVIGGKTRTNVDGKGRGAYKDAFVLAKVDLKATKENYKEGHLDKEYTVEQFAKLPDSLRVVYIEPEPGVQQFKNVDSLTNEPIVGVRNEIQRNSVDGNTYSATETSNRNGVFDVKAISGDKIDINSEHEYYEPKHTAIQKFDKGQTIRMTPKKLDLTFRTVDADSWELLPECRLEVRTSRSGVTTPVSSGTGEFEVRGLYYGETISITASKKDYSTNNTTVHDAKVSELANAPQRNRDIPLHKDLPPCNGGNSEQNNVAAGTVSAPQSFNMGTERGTFVLDYYTGNKCPDRIDVYNHKPGESAGPSNRLWTSDMAVTGDNHRQVRLSFSSGSVITVIVTTGPEDGSAWSYHVYCPN